MWEIFKWQGMWKLCTRCVICCYYRDAIRRKNKNASIRPSPVVMLPEKKCYRKKRDELIPFWWKLVCRSVCVCIDSSMGSYKHWSRRRCSCCCWCFMPTLLDPFAIKSWIIMIILIIGDWNWRDQELKHWSRSSSFLLRSTLSLSLRTQSFSKGLPIYLVMIF